MEYPFKSKIKYFHPSVDLKQTHSEFRRGPLDKLQRPYYSPTTGSWEIDVVYAPNPRFKYNPVYYLFCVNINTKYLVVFQLKHGHSQPEISDCINKLRDYHFISNIRGDGEVNKWFFKNSNNIISEYYSSHSPFDNHNRVVDRTIRTIRDAVGPNYNNMANPEAVQLMVDYYNHTPHMALKHNQMIFTPEEVESNRDLEGLLIRKNKERCDVVEQKQRKKGLFEYEKGNVLLVHLDLSRTPYRFMKKRRTFNALAIFLNYWHGNVRCIIYRSGFGIMDYQVKDAATPFDELEAEEEDYDKSLTLNLYKPVIVPIYYTKLVCERLEDLPERYKYFF
jgi:hypothetical protein